MDRERHRELRRLAREAINGKPLAAVPLGRFSELRAALCEARAKAVSLGQIRRLKAIQRVITEIRRLERMSRRGPGSGGRPRDEDSRIDAVIAEIQENPRQIPELEMEVLPAVIRRLKLTIAAAVKEANFPGAQAAMDLRESLKALLTDRQRLQRKDVRDDKVLKSLEAAEAELDKAIDTYEKELNELDLEAANAHARLRLEVQKELEVFDAQSPDLPPFSKAFSSQLQNLKQTQRRLVLTKRYADAGLVFDKVNEMVEIEHEILQDKYIRSQDAKRGTLVVSQSQKIECLLGKIETDRIAVVQAHEHHIAVLKQKVQNIERKLGHADFRETIAEPSPVSEWSSIKGPTKRSQAERLLARRKPWNLSRRVESLKALPRKLEEPSWKSVCHPSTRTEVIEKSSARFRVPSDFRPRKSPCWSVSTGARPGDRVSFVEQNRSAPVSRRRGPASLPKAETVTRASAQSDSLGAVVSAQTGDVRNVKASQTKRLAAVSADSEESGELAQFADSLPPSRKVSAWFTPDTA
jgi:hypothetical protein